MDTLYIGNKNYSSWSMRPWVLMTDAGIPFTEHRVRFDAFTPDADFKRRMQAIAPTALVPVLVQRLADGSEHAVWDSLAIAETLAERHPDKRLWPRDAPQRARARSLCAELHAGFRALRGACPQNLEAHLPEVGRRLLAEQPEVAADLARIDAMWTTQLREQGGPWLFGAAFGIADAFYAPVAGRIRTYGLPVSAEAAAYVERLFQRPSVAAWVRDALAEQDFLAFNEPYRTGR
ncbi:MAG: glutathione S-transferase family protein [Burkholderiales bacterium]